MPLSHQFCGGEEGGKEGGDSREKWHTPVSTCSYIAKSEAIHTAVAKLHTLVGLHITEHTIFFLPLKVEHSGYIRLPVVKEIQR